MYNNNYDKYYNGVMALATASNRRGLCYFNSNYLQLLTDKEQLDRLQLATCEYIYYPNLDRVHYVEPSAVNPGLLIPTRERAIVDYIKLLEEYGDEGILIESLQSYLYNFSKDLPKLYEVADFFQLSRDSLDYWLEEARNESDMSMG